MSHTGSPTTVTDIDAHAGRAVAAGGLVIHGPADMPYGVRGYTVREHEGSVELPGSVGERSIR
jgi:hypothetical protein